MSPEAAVMLLVYVLVICVIAWVAVYIAGQMGAPAPARTIIWAIALILILVVVLRFTGLLHAAVAAVGL